MNKPLFNVFYCHKNWVLEQQYVVYAPPFLLGISNLWLFEIFETQIHVIGSYNDTDLNSSIRIVLYAVYSGYVEIQGSTWIVHFIQSPI